MLDMMKEAFHEFMHLIRPFHDFFSLVTPYKKTSEILPRISCQLVIIF